MKRDRFLNLLEGEFEYFLINTYSFFIENFDKIVYMHLLKYKIYSLPDYGVAAAYNLVNAYSGMGDGNNNQSTVRY